MSNCPSPKTPTKRLIETREEQEGRVSLKNSRIRSGSYGSLSPRHVTTILPIRKLDFDEIGNDDVISQSGSLPYKRHSSETKEELQGRLNKRSKQQ